MAFDWPKTKKWVKKNLWKAPKDRLRKRFKKEPRFDSPPSPGSESSQSSQMTSAPVSVRSTDPWRGLESPFIGPPNRAYLTDEELNERLIKANIWRPWSRTC
ncbi:hypothetical protein IG631_19935 [Alternaria alternata]|nr:hypothetical protein IG631_19935 [Alternaria alternata]